ncbi:MAG: glycosyltransferase [Flavobacteriales bacterium]|nr:glycosyltransferase [Flavobacteriales bacterium]
MNSSRYANSINCAIEKLGYRNLLLFTDSDMYRSRHLNEFINPSLFIYYTRDNLMTVSYWSKHGTSLEPEIMESADLVVANSMHLVNLALNNNSNSFYVGQGCESEDYLVENIVSERPIEFSKIKGSVIGYVGLLTSRRLDIDLLIEIATKRPDCTVMLVGPEETCFKESDLHSLSNVVFVGKKSPESLPSYVSHFDVCINPQIVNDLTKGNYPRKIDEYLASGNPIVATYTPTMEVFKDHCFLAKTNVEFLIGIDKALVDLSELAKKKRIEFAQTHTWAKSVNEIWESVAKINF